MNARIISYSADNEQAYCGFAKKSWGKNSYQSNRGYLQWLYCENPLQSKKEKDFLLIVTENNEVVGCIHKLRIPWILDKVHLEIPAVHNLAVNEQYRGSHALPLMFESFHDDEHVFIPGAIPPVSTIYEKLKSQPAPIHHYRKILRPISGAIQKITKLKKNNTLAHHIPSERLLESIVKTLSKRTLQRLSIDWSVELVRWRFFHELGPRHLLVYRELSDNEIDFMIISLGSRHGFNVARIIEFSIQNEKNAFLLMAEAEAIIKKEGAHVFFAYGFDRNNEYLMNAKGWKKINNPAKAFFYHKNKNDCFKEYHISMSCTDFGFEAIAR